VLNGDGNAAVGIHRGPWGTRRDGAVLCIGSCRDLPVTRSIIAKGSVLARDPLWDAEKEVSGGLGGLPTAVDAVD
jgi:hypothetical protein